MPGRSADEAVGPIGIADRFLERWHDWRRSRKEFGSLDRLELERLAGEFGMSARDLEDLSARGAGAADLLYERMHALGITRADADRMAQNLLRDLEKTCSCCCDKPSCRKDLARRPEDPAWKAYCPNVTSLESIQAAKGRFPV